MIINSANNKPIDRNNKAYKLTIIGNSVDLIITIIVNDVNSCTCDVLTIDHATIVIN